MQRRNSNSMVIKGTLDAQTSCAVQRMQQLLDIHEEPEQTALATQAASRFVQPQSHGHQYTIQMLRCHVQRRDHHTLRCNHIHKQVDSTQAECDHSTLTLPRTTICITVRQKKCHLHNACKPDVLPFINDYRRRKARSCCITHKLRNQSNM